MSLYTALTHPKYAGCHVYGRTSSRLRTPTIKQSRSQWVITPNAFEPIVDEATFEQAQKILQSRTYNKSDAELLDDLRRLLAAEGRISLELIQNRSGMASPAAYRGRFGNLRREYELVGYGRPEQFGPSDLRRRTMALREELVNRLVAMFPDKIAIVKRSGRWRSRL